MWTANIEEKAHLPGPTRSSNPVCDLGRYYYTHVKHRETGLLKARTSQPASRWQGQSGLQPGCLLNVLGLYCLSPHRKQGRGACGRWKMEQRSEGWRVLRARICVGCLTGQAPTHSSGEVEWFPRQNSQLQYNTWKIELLKIVEVERMDFFF